jgi:hypothetical protein
MFAKSFGKILMMDLTKKLSYNHLEFEAWELWNQSDEKVLMLSMEMFPIIIKLDLMNPLLKPYGRGDFHWIEKKQLAQFRYR